MNRKAFFASVFIVIIIVASLSFFILNQRPRQEIKIGVILPLSGPDSSVGQDIKLVTEFAVDIINGEYDLELPLARSSGLSNFGGAKIKVIWGDSQGNISIAISEAERLIVEEGVVSLIGEYRSSITHQISEVAEDYGIPFVCGISTSTNLTERGYQWFFRTTPQDNTFSSSLLQFSKEVNETKHLGLNTVAIVSTDDEWGLTVIEDEEYFINSMNFQLIETLIYDKDIVNASSQALSIKMLDPDIIIHNSYTFDAILFMQEYKKINWLPKLFLVQGSGFETHEFLQILGGDADFIVTRSVWQGLENNLTIVRQVNDIFRMYHPEEIDLDGTTSRQFTALMVLVESINRAVSTEPDQILNALQETDWSAEYLITGWDGVKFDSKGQNIEAKTFIMQRLNGEWKIVWPSDLAFEEVEIPSPDWDER